MRLSPFNVRHLAHTCLSASAYLTWNLNLQEMCADQAKQNRVAGHGDITEDMLLDNGPYSDLESQMALPDAAYQQCAQAVECTWATVPEEGVPVQSFLQIMQGSQEPYVQFLARSQEAVKHQIPHTTAAEMLTLTLAFENADADCKHALAPVRCIKNLGNFLRACQDVGTELHRFAILMQAVANLAVDKSKRSQRSNPKMGKCYNCGKPGHLKKECRQISGKKGPYNAVPHPAEETPGLCPCCNRGNNWANQCHPKFHQNGTPLLGNETGAWTQAPQTMRAFPVQTSIPFQAWIPRGTLIPSPQEHQE
ncbi:endogenous retrovirus group K member 5 Gag polyprotein-like [Chlorocebus sabaeus]|uniref:endogenous retrovirus group K member 5 Gag polyprotein-like n=1 Tax=Chlorocebus sabaeus TaxID=60711 RepID=UPI003BF9B1A0